MKKFLIATMSSLLLASAAMAQTAAGPTRPAAPSKVYMPTDAERARWTMADMRTWTLAILSYKADNGRFPTAKTMTELRRFATPKYLRFAALTDAWGNQLRYNVSGDGTSFILVSAGSDGTFDPRSWRSAGSDIADYSQDAVMNNQGEMKMFRGWAFN